jgi:hypothetical protein
MEKIMPAISLEMQQSLKRSQDAIEQLQLKLRGGHGDGDFFLHVFEYRDVAIANHEHVIGIGVRVNPISHNETRQLFILVEDGVVTRFDVPDRPSANQNGINRAIVAAHDWYKTAPRPGFN